MTDLYFWKLALDGALVASLVYMCMKFRGSSGPSVNTGYLRELESSLKQLLKEAERSSLTLGEELTKKKGQLEQLLFDIETAEQRMNRAIDEASDAKRGLREVARRAQENIPASAVAQEPAPVAQMKSPEPQPVREQVSSRRVEEPAPQSYESEPQYDYASAPEPPSFENLGSRAVERHRRTTQREQSQSQTSAPANTGTPVNIYGEPISHSGDTHASLRETVEREVMPDASPQPEPQLERSLEDIYGAADDLLRAGQSLEHVSRTTQLPIDEVRMLSEIISREQLMEQPQDDHVSPVRRETQVL